MFYTIFHYGDNLAIICLYHNQLSSFGSIIELKADVLEFAWEYFASYPFIRAPIRFITWRFLVIVGYRNSKGICSLTIMIHRSDVQWDNSVVSIFELNLFDPISKYNVISFSFNISGLVVLEPGKWPWLEFSTVLFKFYQSIRFQHWTSF